MITNTLLDAVCDRDKFLVVDAIPNLTKLCLVDMDNHIDGRAKCSNIIPKLDMLPMLNVF